MALVVVGATPVFRAAAGHGCADVTERLFVAAIL
jgi:hypothetical protein